MLVRRAAADQFNLLALGICYATSCPERQKSANGSNKRTPFHSFLGVVANLSKYSRSRITYPLTPAVRMAFHVFGGGLLRQAV